MLEHLGMFAAIGLGLGLAVTLVQGPPPSKVR